MHAGAAAAAAAQGRPPPHGMATQRLGPCHRARTRARPAAAARPDPKLSAPAAPPSHKQTGRFASNLAPSRSSQRSSSPSRAAARRSPAPCPLPPSQPARMSVLLLPVMQLVTLATLPVRRETAETAERRPAPTGWGFGGFQRTAVRRPRAAVTAGACMPPLLFQPRNRPPPRPRRCMQSLGCSSRPSWWVGGTGKRKRRQPGAGPLGNLACHLGRCN